MVTAKNVSSVIVMPGCHLDGAGGQSFGSSNGSSCLSDPVLPIAQALEQGLSDSQFSNKIKRGAFTLFYRIENWSM